MVCVTKQLVNRLDKIFSNKFVRNYSWLGMSEIFTGLTFGSTVVLARYLTPYDYGLAAIVLTVYQFTQVFTNTGIGARLFKPSNRFRSYM